MSTFQEKKQAFKSGTAKFFRRLMLILLSLGIITLLFLQYGTYSEGVRAGIVLKVSKKGALMKTYEGQLDLLSFGAVNSPNQLSQTFEFSIPKDDVRLIEQLEQVALNGERINLRYEEKYAALPWRGDTKYMVISVERAKNTERKDVERGQFPQ